MEYVFYFNSCFIFVNWGESNNNDLIGFFGGLNMIIYVKFFD